MATLPDPARPAIAPLARRLAAIGVPIAVALVAFIAYGRTMLPGVGIWDTAEFQTVPRVLGIMHATGYPLYTLVGAIASALPLGSVAYRMNLLSGLCAAVAAGLVAAVSRRLGAPVAAAGLAGLAFAFFLPLWNTAVRADPHTLHAVFVAIAVAALAAWREAPTARRLAILGLVVGLSLSNHMQTAMWAPGLLVGVLWGRLRALSPRTLAAGVAAGIAGLLPYLYLPLRARQNPPLDYGHPVDWPRFHALVFGEHFQQDMGFFSAKGVETFLVQAGRLPEWYAGWLGAPLAGLLAAGALAGLVALWRRDRGLAVALALLAFVPLYWACTWVNGDVERYFIGPTAVALVLLAVGLGAIARPLAARWPRAATIGLAVLALVPFTLVPGNGPRVDRSTDHAGEAFTKEVLERLPPRAAVFTVWVDSTPLWYAKHVEGRRPDVRVVDDSEVVAGYRGDLAAAVRALLAERPVYVLHPAGDGAAIAGRFHTRTLAAIAPFGYPLVEVTP